MNILYTWLQLIAIHLLASAWEECRTLGFLFTICGVYHAAYGEESARGNATFFLCWITYCACDVYWNIAAILLTECLYMSTALCKLLCTSAQSGWGRRWWSVCSLYQRRHNIYAASVRESIQKKFHGLPLRNWAAVHEISIYSNWVGGTFNVLSTLNIFVSDLVGVSDDLNYNLPCVILLYSYLWFYM